MPEWQDTGFVLGTKRLGENSIILSILTQEHGRHLGLIRTKTKPLSGCFAQVKWKARLSEHLGTYTIENIKPFSAKFMDDRKRLSAISSLCTLLEETLAERENVSDFYHHLIFFLENIQKETWIKEYVCLEVKLLKTIGFGLDLSKCAAGGNSSDLAYISPKTGRAVSKEKGKPYHEKLLLLPSFLWKDENYTLKDIYDGLQLTGYFLSQHIKKLPITRNALFPSLNQNLEQ